MIIEIEINKDGKVPHNCNKKAELNKQPELIENVRMKEVRIVKGRFLSHRHHHIIIK